MKYVFLAVCLLLASCADKPDENAFTCPEIGLIKDFDVVELANKNIKVEITQMHGECTVEDNMLSLDITMPLRAHSLKKGEAVTSDLDVKYFVSILSEDQSILSKKVFTAKLEPDDKGAAVATEEHVLEIPVKSPADGDKFKVIYGFVKEDTNEQQQ